MVKALRSLEHEVYDFRSPAPQTPGFAWKQLDSNWENWDVQAFQASLKCPRADEAFGLDRQALESCELCVLVLPSGNSSHLEAGWCAARGLPVYVYSPDKGIGPELMYKLFEREGEVPLFSSLDALLKRVREKSRSDFAKP